MAIMIPPHRAGTHISIDDSFLLEDPIKIPVITYRIPACLLVSSMGLKTNVVFRSEEFRYLHYR
jgi:hypothetical protein